MAHEWVFLRVLVLKLFVSFFFLNDRIIIFLNTYRHNTNCKKKTAAYLGI